MKKMTLKVVALLVTLALVLHLAEARFPFHQTKLSKPKPSKPIQDAGDALFLTNWIEAGLIKEAKTASKVYLPEFMGVESYSGYLTVNKTENATLFFWFFPSENNYKEDPVLLWLQGGPGSSSLYGLFTENGPFSVDVNGSVHLREYSWHKNYSILYIDQPVGTGFSFTTNGASVRNQIQVGEHLYSALTQFFTVFSELQNNSFYITGESYAGKYIPAIAHTIHQKNPKANLTINLQGLLIGNGLSDPVNQFNYGDLLYQIGLIDTHALEEFKDMEQLVGTLIKQQRYQEATYYWSEMVDILFSDFTGLHNIYNYVENTEEPDYYIDFLELDHVRRAIHVGNFEYNDFRPEVYSALYADITKSVVDWVSELLNHYRILFFNGQLDIIVGYVLTENYLKQLNFSAAAEYAKAGRNIWYVDNQVAGYVKSAGNLTEVLVRDAGHMVPADQPKAAFDLVNRFINRNL